jgi:hypothetical protein
MSEAERGVGLHLAIGRGGWTIYYERRETPTGSCTSRLSHYGDTWREHTNELAPGALATDTRVIEDLAALSVLAVSGPMVDPQLPAGSVSRFSGGVETWRDAASGDRDRRFGDAAALDYVAADVYARIVERFGGCVFDPHRAAARTAHTTVLSTAGAQRDAEGHGP